MRRTKFDDWPCPIARATDLIGDWWTPLVLRELFSGHRRFDAIQESIGIPRAVLAQRLDRLVAEGMVTKVAYEERPPRYEYRLTDKGLDLWPVMVTLMQYGDRYYAPDGPPVVLTHRDCGGELDVHRTCLECGAKLGARDVRAHEGPGASVPPVTNVA